jgi:hypothetical protein
MKNPKLTRRQTLSLAVAFFVPSASIARAANLALPAITTYRNPGCGCCEKWAAMLRASGFTITMQDDEDLAARKTKAGVPDDLAGCHTAFMGDYIIEGHVPLTDIMRLVTETPKIKGLAVPGMPMGSQGMETEQTPDHYDVVAFMADGKRETFSTY